MKRILIIIFTVFLAACGTTTEEQKNIDNVESTDKNEGTATQKEETGEHAHEYNQLIVDNANVRATLIGVTQKNDDIWGNSIEVRFEIENKTAKSLEAQARSVSVDGRMVDETILSMSQEIAPGKIADAVLTMTEFEGYELPALENNLEMTLHVFSWEDTNFEEDHQVKIDFK